MSGFESPGEIYIPTHLFGSEIVESEECSDCLEPIPCNCCGDCGYNPCACCGECNALPDSCNCVTEEDE